MVQAGGDEVGIRLMGGGEARVRAGDVSAERAGGQNSFRSWMWRGGGQEDRKVASELSS